MEPPNFHYTLPALAKKWNKSENDILQIATLGGLALSVKHNSIKLALLDAASRNSGYVQLELSDVQFILDFGLIAHHEIHVARCAGEEVAFSERLKKRKDMFPFSSADKDPPLVIKSITDIFIHCDEVFRVEKIYPEIAQKPYKQDHSQQLVLDAQDDPYTPGREKLCAKFRIGSKSFNSIVRRLKRIGLEMEYTDTPRPIPRLRLSVIKLLILNKNQRL